MTISRESYSQKSLNFMTGTRAAVEIHELPELSFNCINFNLPGISTSAPARHTPTISIPLRGDTLEFEPLTLTFIVQEDLSNWRAGFNWLCGFTAPHKQSEFNKNSLVYSDATIFIHDSNELNRVHVEFKYLTPVALSGLQFTTTDENVTELTANMTFSYQSYDVVDYKRQ